MKVTIAYQCELEDIPTTVYELLGNIKENDLPYNVMHDNYYPSIGCKQCTSSVCLGEDDRSGRWKGTNKTECGLHGKKTISLNGIKRK